MDLELLRVWLAVIQLAGVVGVGVYTWIATRTKANKDAIERTDVHVADNRRRIEVLQSRLDDAPTHADLGQIYDRLNTVANTMHQLNGQLSAVSHQLSMVNEYLLNRSDGGTRG